MPAGSDATGGFGASDRAGGSEQVTLPRTYRPLGARVATALAAVTIVIAVSLLWVLLPAQVQDDFTWPQRITLLAFFAGVLVVLNGIFRTSAQAMASGLVVINGYHRHELAWGQIVRLSLTPNRPWALMDLDDGTTLAVMAIQTSDGARATRSATELAGLLAAQNRTERDS